MSTRLRRWFGSVRTQLMVALLLVTILSALATAVTGVALFRRADETAARRALAVLADTYQAEAQAGTGLPSAAESALGVNKVRKADITRAGRLTGDAMARLALTPAEIQAVVGGQAVSSRVTVGGVVVYVEARPVDSGGFVLAQRRIDAPAIAAQVLPQWYAIIAGISALAAVLGLLLAWWLTRPVQRLASWASALAGGERREAAVRGPHEMRELATGLNQLTTALGHAEARQREFLLSVSHDLRTPLATVSGYAEALADGAIPPEEVAEVGQILQAETSRLNRMVSDLLDLARLDADELTLVLSPVDAVDLVAQAGAAWRERCTSRGLALSVEAVDHPVTVQADAQRLRQAIDGLLDNAVRASPPGAPVVLAVRDEGSEAVVEVRDGGPGLDDDDLSVAFDRGALNARYRGRRDVGTGLGLALVDRLVRRHHGSVVAGHAPEGGAMFTLRLPLSTSGLADRVSPSSP